MAYQITDENLIVVTGGHKQPGLGHQRHYPVFKDDNGSEMISLNGQTLVKLTDLAFDNVRREKVKRG